MQERLQKIIAQAGICSRREAEQIITEGRVTINGKIADELGVKADKSSDHIKVDGKLLKIEDSHRYLLVNKPKGVITSVSDPEGRTTIMDILKGIDARVYPVGRLDFQTEGAILLTNDGDLANRLLSPKSKCPKTYLVKVFGLPDERNLSKVQRGVTIDGTRYGKCKVEVLRPGNNSWLKVVLNEGKNQQIKRVFEFIGHPVSKLKRIGFAFLTSKGLVTGAWRELREVEVERLKRGDYQPLVPIDPAPFLKEFGVPLPKYSPKQRKDDRRTPADRPRHGHSDTKRSGGHSGTRSPEERRPLRPRFDKESRDDRKSGSHSSDSRTGHGSDRRRQENRSDERPSSRPRFDRDSRGEKRPSSGTSGSRSEYGSDRRRQENRSDERPSSRPRFDRDSRGEKRPGSGTSGQRSGHGSDQRRQENRSDDRRPSRSRIDKDGRDERRSSRSNSDNRGRDSRGQGSSSENRGRPATRHSDSRSGQSSGGDRRQSQSNESRTSRPRSDKDPRSRNKNQTASSGGERRTTTSYRKSDPRHSDGPKSTSSKGHNSKPANKASSKKPGGKKGSGPASKSRAAKPAGKGRASGSRFPMDKGKH